MDIHFILKKVVTTERIIVWRWIRSQEKEGSGRARRWKVDVVAVGEFMRSVCVSEAIPGIVYYCWNF